MDTQQSPQAARPSVDALNTLLRGELSAVETTNRPSSDSRTTSTPAQTSTIACVRTRLAHGVCAKSSRL
jgi:hypothetical protein